MEQELFNWVLGGLGTLLGFLLHVIWQAVKELQIADKDIIKKVSSIEVLVAGSYVTRSELSDVMKTVFNKLDRIEAKVGKKVDRD
jgi:hypothetical protein